MSIKKLTLATLILVGLTACGSSGSGSSSNNANSNKPKIVTPKDKVDQAKDKAKTEADRLAKDSEKAKAEAERLAKDAEKAKGEAQRLAKEKAEKAKAEAERVTKEAEKAKTEAERLAKEAERAKQDEEAKKIVESKGIDDKEIGLKALPSTEKEEGGKLINSDAYLYNQAYSVVTAKMEVIRSGNGPEGAQFNPTVEVKGLKTTAEQLPKEGSATYKGKAFNAYGGNGLNGGDLVYHVNFNERSGLGKVENMQGGYIDLEKGNISNSSISANATRYHDNTEIGKGTYKVEFFGPKAEEIGGKVDINGTAEGVRAESFGISGTKAN
ncbi:transferrin-binding protein-like solute binding protein [Mannheimia haemolytica]|nr:factor H binding protein domain-containing protein [Mannheimia haemolytica]MCB4227673.1 transferrin-binding protein-like solute binding protein [Mannheimia haemolytica]